MTTRNIWRSKRLIYQPVETTDEPFLLSLNHHGSDAFQNATHLLPVPQGPRSAVQHREFLQSCLLGCIVYLPAPEVPDSADSNSNTNNDNNTSPSPNQQQEKQKPIPIGTIALQPIDDKRSHHRNTSIGITISHPYQNKGYGSEAILWATEFGFRHANLHRVGIEAFAWNEGAWKLYQRLGFVMEGRARECVWFDGGWCDAVSLGMLEGEWRERYGGDSGKKALV
jgi:RimJ/RimL family protein N-acetyltransferase